ncbi:MAG: cupin domain-containing protein [Candidatus Rokubacteria bacterium]|nr:cupin domain-containing protein [Candidatus Rokubacteria bacterium]
MGGFVSPLATWWPGDGALRDFRRRWLGRAPVVLEPRDAAWREMAPGFRDAVTLAGAGLPFQIVAGDRYERSGDPRRLRPALARGATVYVPQIHQVLPRLMRLMVALRVALLGPAREECSFLLMTEGGGAEGMDLHHDGAVEQFWLQLEGRRTVTVGPPVGPGVAEDLPALTIGRDGSRWRTFHLGAGTLFHLPPRTPHRVVCRRRSLALSLTWGRPSRVVRRSARVTAMRLTDWDVVSGRADRIPPARRDRLWVQVPVAAGPTDRARGELPLSIGGEEVLWLPESARALAQRLALMPSWRAPVAARRDGALALLVAHGVVAPRDLPRWIVPADPEALDGWHFA